MQFNIKSLGFFAFSFVVADIVFPFVVNLFRRVGYVYAISAMEGC